MSTDFDVACHTCKKRKHLGQRMAMTFSFGFGSNDVSGASEASEFICNHLGHDLRIYDVENVPPGFADPLYP